MKRPLALVSAVLVGSILVTQVPCVSSQDKGKPLPAATSASVRQALSEKIDIAAELRQQPVPLKIMLKYLMDTANASGRDLDIAIDKLAFKQNAVNANDLLDEMVELPTFMRKMTTDQCLDNILSQLPGEACYRIRNGVVVITTLDKTRLADALNQKVLVDFQSRTPTSALDELSDLTGVTIGIDPTCEEVVVKRIVSLHTNKDMTLRAVLETIADSCDFKLLVTDERVTVLPRAIHMKRLRGQLEEAKLQRDIDALRPTPNPDRPQVVPAAPEGKKTEEKVN